MILVLCGIGPDCTAHVLRGGSGERHMRPYLDAFIQVEWEIRDDESSGDSDDMNPWELQSPGCSVDDMVEALKGTQPEVLSACSRLEAACTAVKTWVCPSHVHWRMPCHMSRLPVPDGDRPSCLSPHFCLVCAARGAGTSRSTGSSDIIRCGTCADATPFLI